MGSTYLVEAILSALSDYIFKIPLMSIPQVINNHYFKWSPFQKELFLAMKTRAFIFKNIKWPHEKMNPVAVRGCCSKAS